MVKKKTSILPAELGPAVPWLKTMGVAVLGAFLVGALELGLDLLSGEAGARPPLWSLEGLALMGKAGLGGALVVVLAYLKGSPLPRREWSEEERAAERARLEAQGRLPQK